MPPSTVVIPPPLPEVTLGSLLGPVVPLAIGVLAAVLLAALVGTLLRRLGTLQGGRASRGTRTAPRPRRRVRLA
jgi:hypothetical protein